MDKLHVERGTLARANFRLLARALIIALLLLFAAQSTGVYRALFDGRCAAACDDDDASGACGTTCHDCACCGHAPQIVARTPEPLVEPALEPAVPPSTVDHFASRDPGDIFHVPRLALA